MENKINNNARCRTCKKCLCTNCYDRVSVFYKGNKEYVLSKYKCPFCNIEDVKDLESFSSDILIRFTETAVLNFIGQFEENELIKEENTSLKEDFDNLICQLRMNEIEENKHKREAIKYRLLKNEIERLKKTGRKTIQIADNEKSTSKMPQ